MRKDEPVPQSRPWRPHWSDAIWLVLIPVALGVYFLAGIAAAAMACIIAVFVVIGIRSQVHTKREREEHRHRLDQGFWNH